MVALVCRISCQQPGTLATTFTSNAVSNLSFLSLFANNKPNQKEMETQPVWLLKDRQTHTDNGNYLESMTHRRHTGPDSARFSCTEIPSRLWCYVPRCDSSCFSILLNVSYRARTCPLEYTNSLCFGWH